MRRLLAVAALAALAACTKTAAPTPGLNLSEPSAVAVFRGVVTQYAENKAHPYIAIANTGTNELVIVDAINDQLVPGPFPLRGLVYPVAARPMLLASGDLGDVDPNVAGTTVPVPRPDLLVAVSAGASTLQVVRTWRSDGAVVAEVDLGGDILGLSALDFDPAAPGTVQLAAILADRRVALATFRRAAPAAAEPDAIELSTVAVSAPLGFQPVAIAKSPFQRGQVWVASRDDLGGGTFGVAGLDLTPLATNGAALTPDLLDARAPTRLVAALRVRERLAGEDSDTLDAELLGSTGFTPPPAVDRVYAVLDEAGCGVDRAIGCGLVALDPGTGQLALDPVPASSMQMSFRAPIPVPGPLALAVAGPPAVPPPEDARFATSIMRIETSLGTDASSGAAAVASSDGTVWFVDLSRWEVPTHQLLQSSMGVTATPNQPPDETPPIPRNQWLVLQDPDDATTNVKHTELSALASAVVTTPGYTGGTTPSPQTWIVVKEGVLPNLSVRKAEAGVDGTGLWLALQAPGGAGDVARVWDPVLGVQAGDVVLIEPAGLGTCGIFEAEVASVEPPRTSPNAPGGFLRLAKRVTTSPANATWDLCVDRLTAAGSFANLRVSIRAGDYVLIRSPNTTAARAVGRPQVGVRFELKWSDEQATPACTLPPAVPWPTTGAPLCADASCRAPCFDLVRIRHARRLGYVSERCTTPACGVGAGTVRWSAWPDPTGPALAFTLGLESSAAAHRDLSLTLSTADGRYAFREALSTGSGNDARGAVAFDRSPWKPEGGVRFLVPYPAGFVFDGTPTEDSGASELK